MVIFQFFNILNWKCDYVMILSTIVNHSEQHQFRGNQADLTGISNLNSKIAIQNPLCSITLSLKTPFD